MNCIFQVKAGLIALGIMNALVAGPVLANLDGAAANADVSARARWSVVLSVAIRVSVAACGRLIACF